MSTRYCWCGWGCMNFTLKTLFRNSSSRFMWIFCEYKHIFLSPVLGIHQTYQSYQYSISITVSKPNRSVSTELFSFIKFNFRDRFDFSEKYQLGNWSIHSFVMNYVPPTVFFFSFLFLVVFSFFWFNTISALVRTKHPHYLLPNGVKGQIIFLFFFFVFHPSMKSSNNRLRCGFFFFIRLLSKW